MENLDKQTPGGVYLCQVSDRIACGACCGLYNVPDPSQPAIQSMLERRTLLYASTARTYDGLVEFRAIIESEEDQNRPYPEFHHCSYIGLIGENHERPGCLLHPLGLGNNGVDHRGLSDWGGFACASYFCPTCSSLPERFKRILRACAGDWYHFGLVVTETELLSTFFSLIEARLKAPLEPEAFLNAYGATDAVTRFFRLKSQWPFRAPGFNRHGNYFFKDNLYPRDTIPYDQLGCNPSKLDPLFRALGSSFLSKHDLMEAETMIDTILDDTIRALDG